MELGLEARPRAPEPGFSAGTLPQRKLVEWHLYSSNLENFTSE